MVLFVEIFQFLRFFNSIKNDIMLRAVRNDH
jgi:hypothetical protein